MLDLLACIIIRHRESTHRTGRDARNLPIQRALAVLLVRPKAQCDTSNHQNDAVGDHDWVLLVGVELSASLLGLGLCLLALDLGLLLGVVRRVGGAFGGLARLVFGFVLEPGGLRAGLDRLRFVVRRDGGDVRRVDVDQGGGVGFGDGNLGELGGSAGGG